MQALRIVLHQVSANYRREESLENKMTYPLPPKSTIMGALHKACGFQETKEMNISIQGKYESSHKEMYTDYCFLNSTMDDRGILVYMKNSSMLSNAYEKVAKSKKAQGNSFRKNITIEVYNQELLEEYQRLKELNDKIQEFDKKRLKPLLNMVKNRKNSLSTMKKTIEKDTVRYQKICKRELELKQCEKEWKERMNWYKQEKYEKPISCFRSLVTSVKYYEILDEVTLILHVSAEEEVLQKIEQNIFNLTSIGRSEDFVDVKEIERVELTETIEESLISEYSAYIDINLTRENQIVMTKNYNDSSRQAIGTKYMIGGTYVKEDGKRKFNKIPVLYVSEHEVEELDPSRNLFADGSYIVNFLTN